MGLFASGGIDPTTGGQLQPINFTPQAPQIGANQYGTAYGTDVGTSGIGGTDAATQGQYQGMLSTMAQGGGPVPSIAQNNAATGQAQQFAQAQGQSGRGQFGLAGAAHNGMQASSGIGQAGAAQNQVLGAQQQYQGVQALAVQQQQQRSQDLMAAGLDQQTAMAQARLESAQNTTNAQTNKKLLTGILTSGMSALL
jgi:hypothetical protein